MFTAVSLFTLFSHSHRTPRDSETGILFMEVALTVPTDCAFLLVKLSFFHYQLYHHTRSRRYLLEWANKPIFPGRTVLILFFFRDFFYRHHRYKAYPWVILCCTLTNFLSVGTFVCPELVVRFLSALLWEIRSNRWAIPKGVSGEEKAPSWTKIFCTFADS